MNLIDWLRRLGILRFGGEAGVYHNAKERPTSLQMDGVLNSEKDVVSFDRRAEPTGRDLADPAAGRKGHA